MKTGPLAGRRVLAVFAHPDDESVACGATLAWCAAEGARVSLLCATRGEAGERLPGSGDESIALGVVRRGELQQAAARLGIDDVILLDHPDGSLTGVEPALFRHEIVLTLRHLQPDVVITFGPDGLYWHPDHIVVHERVTEAVQTLGAAAPALFYVVVPPGLMRTLIDTAVANPGAPPDLSLWDIDPDAFGAYAPEATLVLDARAYVRDKLDALRCHRTQVGEGSPFVWLTEGQAADLLGREYFVRAEAGARAPSLLDSLRTDTGRKLVNW
ncbi:MAG TPA: PIG-L deacetylase family protein [Vicinamibacterales bacterium]|nr:PIG-L deacetylase family protein [Vicinamibacterales bacterium]